MKDCKNNFIVKKKRYSVKNAELYDNKIGVRIIGDITPKSEFLEPVKCESVPRKLPEGLLKRYPDYNADEMYIIEQFCIYTREICNADECSFYNRKVNEKLGEVGKMIEPDDDL